MPNDSRFKLDFDASNYRRKILGTNIIIHCHHYNARIQRTIEGSKKIDGKRIIKSSAMTVFSEMCRRAFEADMSPQQKFSEASALYSNLGFGTLDVSAVGDKVVTAGASHFVEGWRAGFSVRDMPVCTFTEGYIQGAYLAVTGESVVVNEVECMIQGAARCRFSIEPGSVDASAEVISSEVLHDHSSPVQCELPPEIRSNIDQKKIIDALVSMPIYGGGDGLISAFGVYLANTPADFYNLVSIRFVEAMERVGLYETARALLIADAEACGMNTFRGIMNSSEWDGLIAPMVQTKADSLMGVIAVSNGLGWGNWRVVEHGSPNSIKLVSANGYESQGFRKLRPISQKSRCFMLTGVAAGVMELIYGDKSFEERFGTYVSNEGECICRGDSRCCFSVARRENDQS